jgi:spermidine synthase
VEFPEPDKRDKPTWYYGPKSGIGLLMLHHPRRLVADTRERSLRIGIIGLGAGTLAAYGQPGDYIRYYEINPAVIRIATQHRGYFTFINDSDARVDIVPGDARLSMDAEINSGHSQQFDVLTVDAFSGDAIPVHLLTAEAFAVYLRELKPDGVIALHISNSYLDLRPVAQELAKQFNLRAGWVHARSEGRMYTETDWMLITRNDAVLKQPEIAASLRPLGVLRRIRLWTDDYSNLFDILK